MNDEICLLPVGALSHGDEIALVPFRAPESGPQSSTYLEVEQHDTLISLSISPIHPHTLSKPGREEGGRQTRPALTKQCITVNTCLRTGVGNYKDTRPGPHLPPRPSRPPVLPL